MTQALDVRTIFVMLLVSTLLMTFTLSLGIRASRAPGIAKWSIGQGLYACGWILVALQGQLPEALRVSLASAALVAGVAFQGAAIVEHDGGDAPAWILWLPAGGVALLALALTSRFDLRSLFTGAVFSVALAAVSMLANRGGAGRVRKVLAVSMGAASVAVMVRAVGVYLRPEIYPNMFATSLIHTLTYMILFAVTLTSSFAFLVMQRERAEAELRRLAMFDALTQVLNRRAFLQLAEREMARMQRAGQPFAALMLDLDHFKRVNDRYGHAAGDRVLADFAQRAQASLRPTDLLCRYGGEEFCVLLPATTQAQAMEVAERVRTAVSGTPLGSLAETVTVSIGVASFEHAAGQALSYVIERADAALYTAKGLGRNRVVGVEPERRREKDPASAGGERGTVQTPLPAVVGPDAPLVDHRPGRPAPLRRVPPLGMPVAPRE
jgi:diguanylate cyclase (GGDEF)-like protein